MQPIQGDVAYSAGQWQLRITMNEAPFTVVEIVQGDRSQAVSRIEELFALGVLQPGPKYDIYHSPSVIRQIILQKV